MKNSVLIYAEENNYQLVQLYGTQVPVFRFIPNTDSDNFLEVAMINEMQYQPNRQPTELEQHMINRLFQEMRNYKEYGGTNEFKFVAYDFSLDN